MGIGGVHRNRCLPQQYRARALSFVYAAFSLGMVAGLVCFPAFAAPFGWPTALIAFAAGGIGWGVSALTPTISQCAIACSSKPNIQSRHWQFCLLTINAVPGVWGTDIAS